MKRYSAAILASQFDMAKLFAEAMVLAFGTLTLWLRIPSDREQAGLIAVLAC